MRRIALPLVLVAWLLGDLASVSGLRPVDVLAVALVAVAAVVVRRRGTARIDLAAGGYLVLAVVLEAQVAAGRAGLDDVLVVLTPGLLLLALPQLLDPDERRGVRAVAAAGAALAAWTVVDAGVALVRHGGDAFAFYAVKVDVGTPLADHNVLATLLLVALVAVALQAAEDPRWLPAVLVVTLALGATLSRGGALAAIGAAAVAWVATHRGRFAGMILTSAVASLAIVLGAAVLLGAAVPDPGGPTSVVSRGQLWSAGLDAVAAEPLTGVGADGFTDFSAAAGAEDPRDHTHSLALQAPATLGVPAGLVHVALWLLIIVRGWRHPDRHVRALLVVAGAALVGHGLIEETALRGGVEVAVALLLAIGGSRSHARPR